MAALFDLDTERNRRVDAAFQVIVDDLRSHDPRSRLSAIQNYQSRLAGLHVEATAELTVETGSDLAARRAMNDGRTSKRSIAKAAKRGDAASKNTGLIDKIANGELSEEQLDVIADASSRTDGAAAVDTNFIDEIASVDPDQGETIKNDYLAKRATASGRQTEHDRQRALRRALTYVSKKTGLEVISIESDSVAAKNMWDAIVERSKELYEADGGRDLPLSQHPRTHQQRLNDAAYELICGIATTPTGTKQTPRHSHGDDEVATKPGRPRIFIGMTLDHYLGKDPAAVATQIGLGTIPESVLLDYLEHADIFGVLYDRNGQPLWLGRARRHASLMQRYALMLRDKGCVKCGADPQQCQAHHLTPWNAPAKGTTDLDQLALLCTRCHTQLHANNQTLYQDQQATWRTRPALPHETPPARPAHNRKQKPNPTTGRNQPQQE